MRNGYGIRFLLEQKCIYIKTIETKGFHVRLGMKAFFIQKIEWNREKMAIGFMGWNFQKSYVTIICGKFFRERGA